MLRSVPWLVKRLSLMSPSEVGFRALYETRKKISRIFVHRGRPLQGLRSITDSEYAKTRWFFDLSQRGQVRQYACDSLSWTGHAADQLLRHRFSFFAFRDCDFGDPIRWNYDYRNGVETSLAYGPSLDYRNPRLCGDIKYAWEHNRHHHLVELAKAYYLSDDVRFADEVRAQVESWIAASPYPFGINWTSSLENSIRIINWCFAFRFLEEAGYSYVREQSEFRRRWIASIHEHLRFIAGNLSHHSSANNHLIGEVSGLFIGALMFRFKQSEKWLKMSKEILEYEFLCQNWPDGVNKEQSTNYQVFVFDFVIIPALLGRKNNIQFTDALWRRLEKMAEFIAALIGTDGAVPAIGDGDDAYVVRLAYGSGFSLNRSLLATAASVFGRKDFRDQAGIYDEKSFWLLGPEGGSAFARAERVEAPRRSFPDGGYFILEKNGARLVFDCGPLGYLSLAAHGHADALSILLDYRGKRFLVDPGTYAYHSKTEWRNYFRGTAAHNTVRIAGEDQSVIGGNFMWAEKAQATLLRADESRVCGSHDGYRRLRPPARHEREVVFDNDKRLIRITDRVLTSGRHPVEQFFHCDPGCICLPDGSGYRIEHGGAAVRLVPDGRATFREVMSGCENPIGGWFSPHFDARVPAPTLRLQAEAVGNLQLVTNIILL
jgi:hypothetical protein